MTDWITSRNAANSADEILTRVPYDLTVRNFLKRYTALEQIAISALKQIEQNPAASRSDLKIVRNALNKLEEINE